jgi:predicted metal-dependent hydrolase
VTEPNLDDNLACDCQQPLPALGQRGVELFNQGLYFEAHEELELAWRAETNPVRALYQGVLQIGVGYYHIQRGNYVGARKMIQRGRSSLSELPPVCQGIDLRQFQADYERVEQALIALGPHGIDRFDRSLFRPVPIQSSGASHER